MSPAACPSRRHPMHVLRYTLRRNADRSSMGIDTQIARSDRRPQRGQRVQIYVRGIGS